MVPQGKGGTTKRIRKSEKVRPQCKSPGKSGETIYTNYRGGVGLERLPVVTWRGGWRPSAWGSKLIGTD